MQRLLLGWQRKEDSGDLMYNRLTCSRWWHEWENDQFDELAGALVAGHLIECGSYVTGGFYSEFKDLIKVGENQLITVPCITSNDRFTDICHRQENTSTWASQ